MKNNTVCLPVKHPELMMPIADALFMITKRLQDIDFHKIDFAVCLNEIQDCIECLFSECSESELAKKAKTTTCGELYDLIKSYNSLRAFETVVEDT